MALAESLITRITEQVLFPKHHHDRLQKDLGAKIAGMSHSDLIASGAFLPRTPERLLSSAVALADQLSVAQAHINFEDRLSTETDPEVRYGLSLAALFTNQMLLPSHRAPHILLRRATGACVSVEENGNELIFDTPWKIGWDLANQSERRPMYAGEGAPTRQNFSYLWPHHVKAVLREENFSGRDLLVTFVERVRKDVDAYLARHPFDERYFPM